MAEQTARQEQEIVRLLLEGVGFRFDHIWREFRLVATRSGLSGIEAHQLYKHALAEEVRKVLRAEGIEIAP